MRHVSLTCKNHPELRWSTKECAVSNGLYNGSRNIFFCGKVQDPCVLYSDKSGVDCLPAVECNCCAGDLRISPEDN